MQVIIKTLTGKRFNLEVQPSDTVAVVKTYIQQKENILPEQQRLIFEQTPLSDDITLHAAGIEDQCELFLMLRLKGFYLHDDVKEKWNEYVKMLKRAKWQSIPSSYDEIKQDDKNATAHLLNAIHDHTNNEPSSIRNSSQLIEALQQITEYTIPSLSSRGDKQTFYEFFDEYIQENLGISRRAQTGVGDVRENANLEEPLLAHKQRGCCACIIV